MKRSFLTGRTLSLKDAVKQPSIQNEQEKQKNSNKNIQDQVEKNLKETKAKIKSGYKKVASFDTYDTEYSQKEEEDLRKNYNDNPFLKARINAKLNKSVTSKKSGENTIYPNKDPFDAVTLKELKRIEEGRINWEKGKLIKILKETQK